MDIIDSPFPIAQDDEVFQSQHWRIVVNLNQANLGNLLIVLQRHETSLLALTPDDMTDLLHCMNTAASALHIAFEPRNINYSFLMDRRRHVHMHMIPRYYDERREFAGLIFTDDQQRRPARRLPKDIHRRIVAHLNDAFAAVSRTAD